MYVSPDEPMLSNAIGSLKSGERAWSSGNLRLWTSSNLCLLRTLAYGLPTLNITYELDQLSRRKALNWCKQGHMGETGPRTSRIPN